MTQLLGIMHKIMRSRDSASGLPSDHLSHVCYINRELCGCGTLCTVPWRLNGFMYGRAAWTIDLCFIMMMMVYEQLGSVLLS